MGELWDLAQSPALQDAPAQVLQMVWTYLQEEGWATAFVLESTTHNTTEVQQEQRLPLAKLISQFKASCQQVYKIDDDTDKDHMITSLTAKLERPHVYLIQSNPIQSNPIQSNPIQSNPIQSNPIQSNPIQSNPIQSNPIQCALQTKLVVLKVIIVSWDASGSRRRQKKSQWIAWCGSDK
jgi:hypothetical protein